MAGSSARGVARLLAGAAPALHHGFKAPPRPSAAAHQVPPSRSLATTARVHDEGHDSERFWRMVFVVGSVAFSCRVVKLWYDKHTDLVRAREQNVLAWAESRKKDDVIKMLEWMLKARERELEWLKAREQA